jgi:hypothetical protein
MKRFFVLLLILVAAKLQAQFSESAIIKAGVGYTHDFPGLNGKTFVIEYAFPLVQNFQGAIGAKRVDISGYPRTTHIQEYTKATTIDFNLYWLPVQSETQLFRVGLGYSFSFYRVMRAYPLVVSGDAKSITWAASQSKGRTHGINLIAEYEYRIPATIISIGLRGAMYKAYMQTYFIGPVMGVQL